MAGSPACSEQQAAGRLLLLLALSAAAWPALAGPPFVTDDPEPVDYQHVEINLAAQGTQVKSGWGGNLPAIDINYGLLPETQFHVGLFGPFQALDGQRLQIGYGDTELGLKVRFLDEDEEGWRPQLALYPNVELPSGDARRGLGAGHAKLFLPLWAQKSIGDWQTYGGGGYWLNRHGDDRDYWFFGWTVLRKVSDRWLLGGEIFHQTADLVRSPAQGGNGLSSRDSSGFNLGGYYSLAEDRRLMFTFGRGLQNIPATNRFSYYLGHQLTF